MKIRVIYYLKFAIEKVMMVLAVAFTAGTIVKLPIDRSADDVLEILEQALKGSLTNVEWFEFKSHPIVEQRLEGARRSLAYVKLPLKGYDLLKVVELVERIEDLRGVEADKTP